MGRKAFSELERAVFNYVLSLNDSVELSLSSTQRSEVCFHYLRSSNKSSDYRELHEYKTADKSE